MDQKIKYPTKGKYIVAVSGGVDSLSLLDILVRKGDYELIVAHFDHGIREYSYQDFKFVKSIAAKYNVEFVGKRAYLGANTSEEKARNFRYKFLKDILKSYNAKAIITAHHRDDLLETAIMNLIRGTGRKGLSSLSSSELIERPLLAVDKNELIYYANQNSITWHEDSTNSNTQYLRNYIRQNIMTRLSKDNKQKLYNIIIDQKAINDKIDIILNTFLDYQKPEELNRDLLKALPFKVSLELIAEWLRFNKLANFNYKTIESLTVRSKVKPSKTCLNIYSNHRIYLEKHKLSIIHN